MPRTKKIPIPQPKTPPAAEANGPPSEVFTLAEAAAYLRLSEADLVDLVRSQGLPGRFTGREWRFLKTGLQDWLRTPARQSGKEAFLALAGVWKDDPDIEEIVQEVHRQRGRRIVENES